jgi:hypothetical protein
MECHGTDQDVMRVFVPYGERRHRPRSARRSSSSPQATASRCATCARAFPTLEDVFAKALGEQ